MLSRQVVQDVQAQGTREKVIYSLTTTPWGSSPASVSVKVEDTSDSYKDVTTDVTSGAVTVVGDVITLPIVQTLTQGHLYRVSVRFDTGGNTFEAWFTIQGER